MLLLIMVKRIYEIDLVSKTSIQRKKILEDEIAKLPDVSNIEKDFQRGKKIEQLLKMGLKVEDIIMHKSHSNDDIKNLFEKFKTDFIREISEKVSSPKPSVYTITDTPVLAKANTFTRDFSTKLGKIWEDIAFLSSKVISIEKIFHNIKIRGVDLIIADDQEFCFCQIKTMKGTLTGSQVPRSVNELKIYEKSNLVAALNLGSWTFNSKLIPRVSGKEFWDRIEIEYDVIIENTKNLLSSMEDFIKKMQWNRRGINLKCLSFFSGCLGLDTGLEKAGIEHILFCENDKNAAETIQLNKPQVPLISDILDYDANEIRQICGLKSTDKIDLIVGGPPCQAFSTAGKRASFSDPRGNVFLHFIDLICEIKPKYFVIENVRGLLSAALEHRPHSERGKEFSPLKYEEMPGGALEKILNLLRGNGYEVSFNLYNSANYGVPQKRERLIIIGTTEGRRVPYLKPTHSEGEDYGLPKWKTFREISKGLTEKNAEYVKFSENRLKYYKHLKAGQYWKNLPQNLIEEAMGKSFFAGGGKTGFYRRVAWDKPTPTLVTHPAMPATDLCHPEKLRPLSVQEYARIQQFPDTFKFSGTTLEKYKQIGNAVPVGLGEIIGKHLINHKNKVNFNENEFINFPYSRYKNTSDKTWMNSGQLSLEFSKSLSEK